jgi:ABC-2 type transport system permease protein
VVGVLIRMKLTVMRRTATGPRAGTMLTGAVAGVVAAIGTLAIATLEPARMTTAMDLLAIGFATWVMGWTLAPAYGGQPVLRPEHFTLLPIAPRRLAISLLATGFVGVATVITLIAFFALVVFAARLGAVPVMVAVPGLALQLALVVVLSRLAARMFGALARSRLGGVISALITAVMLVVASSGWIVFVALDAVLVTGFSSTFSDVVRALPSGWALVAVEASSRTDWAMVMLALLGLTALVGLLVAVWSRLLGPARLARPVVLGSAASSGAPRLPTSSGATSAVFLKELRSWSRDPVRLQSLVAAPAFALMTCLLPLTFDSTAFLAFIGALTALMGAVTSANLYGQDGTALWLTLVTSGGERADVRGRQLAWLAVFGPMTIVLTIAGTIASGQADLWPWALATSGALLGGGAGLLPLVAIDQLVPGPDPREHKDAPLEHGDLTGQAIVMMLLALGTALPAVATGILGAALDSAALRWLGVPVGALTGVLAYALLGRTARRILIGRGPELLHLMRAGTEHEPQAGEGASVLEAMPRSRRRLLRGSAVVGCVALFPQALVRTLMKVSGDIAQVWFLALYMPGPWQWPTIAFMFLLGTGALALGWRIYVSEERRLQRRRAGAA